MTSCARLRPCLALLGLALPLLLGAEAPDATAVHDELRALKDRLVEAINRGDYQAVLPYLAKDVLVTWQNAELCRGPAEVKAYLDRMTTGSDAVVRKVTVAPEADALTTLYGDDTGVVTGRSADRFELARGPSFELATRWTATIVREDGGWKLAAFHASANLFDNPLLNAASKSLRLVGVGALVVGALGGFVGARLSRRK